MRDVPLELPPGAGLRFEWQTLPERVQLAVEDWLGDRVAVATTQKSGFSPGVAARLETAAGRRLFLKAVSATPNADAPLSHRQEARVVSAIPTTAPVPPLLWTFDEGGDGWVVLVFEDVEGWLPTLPWRPDELSRVLDAMAALAASLTPAPPALSSLGGLDSWYVTRRRWWPLLRDAPPTRLDDWSRRHAARLAELEAAAVEAGSGTTLGHLDIRADNLLLTPDRVYVVDWAAARVCAPWVDALFFAPSVAMQGGPPPEDLLQHYAPVQTANPAAITAVVAAITGFFTYQALQPAPPGLPTLRAFQDAQGIAARQWLSERTGWR
jgi:aminoglycoside phosphotransferase (APT) family kinase protein